MGNPKQKYFVDYFGKSKPFAVLQQHHVWLYLRRPFWHNKFVHYGSSRVSFCSNGVVKPVLRLSWRLPLLTTCAAIGGSGAVRLARGLKVFQTWLAFCAKRLRLCSTRNARRCRVHDACSLGC